MRERAFHPEKWIFSFEKKGEKSVDSLHEARGGSFWSAYKRSTRYVERTSTGAERTNGIRGLLVGGEERIESKTAMVAKGK